MSTMGQKFRAAREAKNITVSRAAAMTHIKTQHIELMERDDFSTMPAPTYAKGFIRIYAEFLGLDSVPLVEEYVAHHLHGGAGAPRPRILDAAPSLLEQEEQTGAEAPSPAKRRAHTKALPKIPLPDLAVLQRALDTLVKAVRAWWPRFVAVAVVLMVTAGLARCVLHDSGEQSSAETDGQMNSGAIMQEPPVRYLELPPAENE